MHLSRAVDNAVFLFVLGVFEPRLDIGVHGHHPLINATGAVFFVVSHLKVDVRLPRLHGRFPLHPALEHLAATCVIPQLFLHVRVLVPKLVVARKQLHGSIPNVAGAVDVAVPHFHLRQLEPQIQIARLDVESALPNTARTF